MKTIPSDLVDRHGPIDNNVYWGGRYRLVQRYDAVGNRLEAGAIANMADTVVTLVQTTIQGVDSSSVEKLCDVIFTQMISSRLKTIAQLWRCGRPYGIDSAAVRSILNGHRVEGVDMYYPGMFYRVQSYHGCNLPYLMELELRAIDINLREYMSQGHFKRWLADK